VESLPTSTTAESYGQAIMMIPDLAHNALPHFLNKSWILYGTTARVPFYISGNPVTLHNTFNQNPIMGTLGLAVSA
jgi:hypothetical protein